MQELKPLSAGESKEIYKVDQVFHVADFSDERVAKILCKRRKRDTPLGACARFVRRSLDHLQIRASVKHFGASTIIFLLAYYLVQLAYQFDVPLFCATSLRPDHVQRIYTKLVHQVHFAESTGNSTDTVAEKEDEVCRHSTKKLFQHIHRELKPLLPLITFLISFYISNIVRRWWGKVRTVPEVENPLLILAGLLTRDQKAAPNSLKSAETVTEVKKMVCRYCLLAWTMCFNSISQPLRKEYGSGRKLIEKKMLRESEKDALRLDEVPADCVRIGCDKWWVPLTWAINLVNEMGPYGPKDQMVVPKDHKDPLSALVKFKMALEDQKVQAENQLPSFYKRLIHWVLVVWMVGSVLGMQHTTHHKEEDVSLPLALLLNFPSAGVLVNIVLIGCISMTDILDNPFGFNKDYDINLKEMLELNIWRCSMTIQEQCLSMSRRSSEEAVRVGEEIQKKLWKIIQPRRP